jgi:hypothetical protein
MSIDANELRQLIIERLTYLGMTLDERGNITLPQADKEFIRKLHQPATNLELKKNQHWIKANFAKYQHFFARGEEIDPLKITPKLIQVPRCESWQNDLWRLVRYTWSLPYSQGYGRRMRYLVVDENNNKLIGIFALQSPPISFSARDRLFTYKPGDIKTALINQTMDIHTLGAVMPYSRLLGGKLIALATASNEVRADYHAKYAHQPTEMKGRELPAELVALTTTSAFGRSSIYNRLRFQNEKIAESLGFTEGYGHFHLQELYPQFKEFLQQEDVPVGGGFGTGPRRKWQIMREALRRLGFEANLLKHGIQREAFIFPLISNLAAYMNGEDVVAKPRDLPFAKMALHWRENWLLTRATGVDGWHSWEPSSLIFQLIPSENGTKQ